MASLGPREGVAAPEGDARAAAIDRRLEARERSLADRIRALEMQIAALGRSDPGETRAYAAQHSLDPAMLHETLQSLRRERYCLALARNAVATLPGPRATSLASLREGFAPGPKRSERLQDDGRGGA